MDSKISWELTGSAVGYQSHEPWMSVINLIFFV